MNADPQGLPSWGLCFSSGYYCIVVSPKTDRTDYREYCLLTDNWLEVGDSYSGSGSQASETWQAEAWLPGAKPTDGRQQALLTFYAEK